MDDRQSIHTITSWEETNRLIHELRAWGIAYLVGEDDPHASPPARDRQAAITLIQRLVQCENPRVRDASIALFLLHPELADVVLEALHTSEPTVVERLAVLTLATLYLQRLWSIQLTLAFGHVPAFPEEPFAFLWQERELPPPSFDDGKWGLIALQVTQQQKSGLSLNYLADWQNQVDHLLFQEMMHRRVTNIADVALPELRNNEEEYGAMSMRPRVDKQQIEAFLKNLGRRFHKAGRLYLVGGAALVHMGIRAGTMEDIYVEVQSADEDKLVETIRQLKESMQVNIEFASPADFIPVPGQWELSAHYVGRYGMIDVFYFDFYSIALSKIQRGSTRDINDVRLLIQQGVITLEGLDAAYQDVLPRVGKRPYNRLDPAQFAARYQTIRQLL